MNFTNRKEALLAIAVAHLVKETLGHQACGVDSYSRQDSLCDHYVDEDCDDLQALDDEMAMVSQVAVIMQNLARFTTIEEIRAELKNYIIEDERYTSDNNLVQEALDFWVNEEMT